VAYSAQRVVVTGGAGFLGSETGRAIPTFIRQALAGEPLTVAGDGSQTRSVCYVDDLVDGVLAATGSASPIEYVERPVDDPQVRRSDTSLAERLLGWHPRVSWQKGLAGTVAWFADGARRTA
jgi:dTDP-glucose 4,6-dehydratase